MLRRLLSARASIWISLGIAVVFVASTVGHVASPSHGAWLTGLALSAAGLLGLAYRGGALSALAFDHLRRERRAVQDASDLHHATIEALAMAIEAKDSASYSHLRDVQRLAGALAAAMGLDRREAQAVQTAALLHDIGMLAVPPHIVAKTGPLTPEELQKVRRHPRLGADIIRHVPFPMPVAPLIESHHERWDGTGYPRGLRSEAIPLGARIIAIVDRFGALMADRPHRSAKTRDEALAILRAEAGTGFDPRLVDTFIRILPEVEREHGVLFHNTEAPPPAEGDDAEGDAIERPRVLEQIARANREFYDLYQMSQAVVTLSIADAMALIASRLSDLVHATSCALFLEEDGRLRCRYASGLEADRIRQVVAMPGEGFLGRVYRAGRALTTTEPLAAGAVERGPHPACLLQSAMACPLLVADRPVGVLWIGHERVGAFEADHVRVLDAVARLAATVIENAILFEQTRRDATTDRLTGLANSRGFTSQCEPLLARALHEGEPLALLMMDVDDLKLVNDTYGHGVGDVVLREVAQTIRSVLRPTDLCARWAGDEFVAALAGCGLADAERRALDLQATLASRPIAIGPGEDWFVRLSVGTAATPDHGRTVDDLMHAADDRMYADKQQHKAQRRHARGTDQNRNDTPTVARQ
jgi:diguanylate cyclase (GGDEF)-like protein/putative nucleotidyltransferase with HDIG domain